MYFIHQDVEDSGYWFATPSAYGSNMVYFNACDMSTVMSMASAAPVFGIRPVIILSDYVLAEKENNVWVVK